MIKIISVTCCPEDTCKDIIIKDVTNLGNRREKNTHLLDPPACDVNCSKNAFTRVKKRPHRGQRRQVMGR